MFAEFFCSYQIASKKKSKLLRNNVFWFPFFLFLLVAEIVIILNLKAKGNIKKNITLDIVNEEKKEFVMMYECTKGENNNRVIFGSISNHVLWLYVFQVINYNKKKKKLFVFIKIVFLLIHLHCQYKRQPLCYCFFF